MNEEFCTSALTSTPTSALASTPETPQLEGSREGHNDSSLSLSRRHFLMSAAICAGGLLLARHPAQADIVDTLNKFFNLDPTVLNYAHEMEELETDFFTRAITSSGYDALSVTEQQVFNLISQQDSAHFAALEQERQRRGTRLRNSIEGRNTAASQRPRTFRYGAKVFNSRENLLREAIFLKENVLFAYHGAVDLVRDPKLLGPAAAIAGVEGRHLVILREMAGLDPVPTSFEGQVSPQKVGFILANHFGFNGGNDAQSSGLNP